MPRDAAPNDVPAAVEAVLQRAFPKPPDFDEAAADEYALYWAAASVTHALEQILCQLKQHMDEEASLVLDENGEFSRETDDWLVPERVEACCRLIRGFTRARPEDTLTYLLDGLDETSLPRCVAYASWGLVPWAGQIMPAAVNFVQRALTLTRKFQCGNYHSLFSITWNACGKDPILISMLREQLPPECSELRSKLESTLAG